MNRRWLIFTSIPFLFLAIAFPSRAGEQKKEYAADKGPSTIDVSTFPPEMQEAYKLFAQKCSRCHTLARPINTDMTTQEWKRYVKRMMNKPDSGISPKQGKAIYKFLKFYQKKKNEEKAAAGGGQ